MIKMTLSLLSVCALMAGCASTKTEPTGELILNKEQVQEALSQAKPPQQFGYNVYPTGNGIALSGKPRLHPNHLATVNFANDFFPVIELHGTAPRMQMMAMIDTAISESWLDYGTATDFRTTFLGLDGRTIPYRGKLYIGQAEAYAAIVPQLRIDQLFIEDSPVFVRMAMNSLGPLGRGIQDPKIDGVIGYEILRNFEYIRFNLAKKTIEFSATTPFTPNDTLLIGAARIVQAPNVGLAVEGGIDGEPTPVVLDFAGNYSLARDDATINLTKMINLGEVVYVNTPTIVGMTPDGLPRAGQGMLQRYVVTVCPRAGMVYFERPEM